MYSIKSNATCTGYVWKLSDEVLGRIEGTSYLENKIVHYEYLLNQNSPFTRAQARSM